MRERADQGRDLFHPLDAWISDGQGLAVQRGPEDGTRRGGMIEFLGVVQLQGQTREPDGDLFLDDTEDVFTVQGQQKRAILGGT